ncbi:uncharacterized protein KIAA2026-like [Chelonus insularis]|uniref:uncharacterized protein KIAA2026-like n=1 Tax=Chelonus insularis TaxID=460826 RepID=UPI00158B08A5|nr:uncharacterized protein KIAA2026-like [Chelonus insularis]XP_034937676.1 uncharacterized protein KIAA2026-like [Chelonus insularis]
MSEAISHSEHEDEKNEKDKEKEIELVDQLLNQLPDTVSNMWEIPQIYEFLCLAKDTLHIQHLSMYEMERMLLIPKASKQLANVMTCLLSPTLPASKYKKIPLMPYDFWTNYLLTHKVPSWFKIYENKDKDSVKVLEAIGIEPEFWKIFPDSSIVERQNFEDFELKQKVWLLKTICDTLMHTRKLLQEEVANKYLDGLSEKILGRDRYGARYIYFPIFLDGDLRVYKHFMNNKIFLNAMPASAKLKLQSTRTRKKKTERKRVKNNRWKNGILPGRSKRRVRVKKVINQVKESIKSEATKQNGMPDVSSNVDSDLNKDVELNKELMDAPSKEAIMDIIGVKPCMIEETDHLLEDISSSSKTDDEKMNERITSGNITSVNTNCVSKSDDEKLIETKTVNDTSNEEIDRIDDKKDDDNSCEVKPELEENDQDPLKEDDKTQNDQEINQDLSESKGIKTRSKIICKKDSDNFNNILTDLEVSKFQLVADSVESLKSLVLNLSKQSKVQSSEAARCELLLLKKLKNLIQSLESKESYLEESTDRAKKKLQSEWQAFKDGNIKNEELSSDSTSRPVAWILGPQGSPLLSCGDSTQRRDNEKSSIKEEIEKNDELEDGDSKEEQRTRRVLRARGVSSYIEPFSSEDDSDSSEPDDWVGFETVDPATGVHTSPHSVTSSSKRVLTGESDATDSDTDWILPSSRKRKKRSLASRRLRSLQSKVQIVKVDGNTGITIDRSVKTFSNPDVIIDNNTDQHDNCNNALNKIKIESVHSVLDIKDEGPINDNQLPSETATSGVQQNYVLVNTGNGPVNYVVMKPDNSSITSGSPVISVVPQVPIHPGYYVQNSGGYIVANPQITNIQSSYKDSLNMQPVIMQNDQNYTSQPNNYVQYQPIGVAPSANSCSPYRGSVPTTPVTVSMQQTRALPRVVQNKPIVFPPRPRHPDGAVIRSTVPFRGNVRGQTMVNNRMPVPRNPNAQRCVRLIRPRLPQAANHSTTNTNKATSLIVLSDDDDEIEMIIPEKSNVSNTRNTTSMDNRTVNKNKPVNPTPTPILDKSGLSPQIIERMNQGGISITPVKRKSPEKQQPISATQLVVVVNETGSHYALSLPNGSKLILTPEQVAQIRASNGGKLIL